MKKENERLKNKNAFLSLIICFMLLVTMIASSAEGPGGTPPGGGGGANTMTYDYTGSLSGTLTADGSEKSSSGETISATEKDVNAALVQNGGKLTIENGTLEKSGDDTDGDSCNFYGVNSVLLSVGEGSRAAISDSSLTADSTGSNAIFATDGGEVYAKGITIETSADNSRGLDATYGGVIIADSATIKTAGEHCASLATDRGGGEISVTNSTLSTAGSGSPLIYSTGNIQVASVTGTASGSQIVGMEGLNTVLIYNSDLTSNLTGKTASDPIANGVIIYQSTSGDAESSTGESARFEAISSSLTSAIKEGAFFYLTNTSAEIYLEDTDINYDSSAAKLLYIAGNDSNNWGSAGSNGANVTLCASNQTLEGDITVDTISSLDFYLKNGSSYTGKTEIETNANGSTVNAPITINVTSGSKWVVTGDCTVSALNVENGGSVVDEDGNTVTIVAGGSTVVSGTGKYTVTADTYSTSVDTSAVPVATTEYIDRTDFDSAFGTSTGFASFLSVANEKGTETAQTSVSETTAVENNESNENNESEEVKTAETNVVLIVVLVILALAAVGAGTTIAIRNKNKKSSGSKSDGKG